MHVRILSQLRYPEQDLRYRGETVQSADAQPPDVIYLVADSTSLGFLACLRYIETVRDTRPETKFKRLRFPLQDDIFSPADLFLNGFDPQKDVIQGRVRWYSKGNDLSELSFEDILCDDNEADVEWPSPYRPTLQHIRANALHGSDPFILPQILTGLTYVQEFALAQERQTAHEIACRCVSRFDVNMVSAIKQISQLMLESTNLMVPQKLQSPYDLNVPVHLVDVDKDAIKRWVQTRCDTEEIQPWFRTKLGQYLDRVVEVKLSGRELLEKWFEMRVQQMLEEKRIAISAWSDPESYVYKERTFIRMLFIQTSNTKRYFYNEDEYGKRLFILNEIKNATEDDVEKMVNLPVKRISREVFKDLTYEKRRRVESDEEPDEEEEEEEDDEMPFYYLSGRDMLKKKLMD